MNELILSISIEPLDEGGYLATSDDLQGLIAQGRTMAETIEIAQDVARKLIESHLEHDDQAKGSHEIWYNPETHRRTTAPNHPGTIARGTLRAIIREAGWSADDFLE